MCVCVHLCEFKGSVGGERRDFAGVLGDVAVEARRRIQKVLHVFIDALHFPLKTKTENKLLCQKLIITISIQTHKVQRNRFERRVVDTEHWNHGSGVTPVFPRHLLSSLH